MKIHVTKKHIAGGQFGSSKFCPVALALREALGMKTETPKDRPVSLVMALVAELAAVNGVSKINTLPGCWEFKIDEHWTIAVNGSNKPREHQGLKTPPFSMWVFFNGWPAGLLNPVGGTFVSGTVANEDEFALALAKRIGDNIPKDLMRELEALPGFRK